MKIKKLHSVSSSNYDNINYGDFEEKRLYNLLNVFVIEICQL